MYNPDLSVVSIFQTETLSGMKYSSPPNYHHQQLTWCRKAEMNTNHGSTSCMNLLKTIYQDNLPEGPGKGEWLPLECKPAGFTVLHPPPKLLWNKFPPASAAKSIPVVHRRSLGSH